MNASQVLSPGLVAARDYDLADRHRYGDESAFQEIYDRFSPMVYNLGLRLSGDPVRAQDLSQEVFLRVWKGLPRYRGRSSLKTWIYRIALNHCRGRLGRRGLEIVDWNLGQWDRGPADPARGPEETLVARDSGRRIAAALAALPVRFPGGSRAARSGGAVLPGDRRRSGSADRDREVEDRTRARAVADPTRPWAGRALRAGARLMGAHLAIESLSAYLDHELEKRDLRLVEAHVVECPRCHQRLQGLRRVVDELQRLSATSAPPVLGRVMELEAGARWRARREQAFRGSRSGSEIAQGPIRLASAMVVVVAMTALLVAHAMSRQGAPETRFVVPPAGAVVPAAEQVEAGGRLFVLEDGFWWQEDLLTGGEAQVPSDAPLSGPEALERAPWLLDLLRRGPVVLDLDGATVVVDPAIGEPARPVEHDRAVFGADS